MGVDGSKAFGFHQIQWWLIPIASVIIISGKVGIFNPQDLSAKEGKWSWLLNYFLDCKPREGFPLGEPRVGAVNLLVCITMQLGLWPFLPVTNPKYSSLVRRCLRGFGRYSHLPKASTSHACMYNLAKALPGESWSELPFAEPFFSPITHWYWCRTDCSSFALPAEHRVKSRWSRV